MSFSRGAVLRRPLVAVRGVGEIGSEIALVLCRMARFPADPWPPKLREVMPVAAERSMRSRSGRKRSRGLPITLSALQRNRYSAAGLNIITFCCSSTVTMASIAECRMPSRRA